jgi:CRISPR system Cascade subunit CasA
MNLLEEAWIPVRRASGERQRITPSAMTDGIDTDPIVALDAPRPDFNGALIQFLIGLVQTAWVLGQKYWDREEMLWAPPSPQLLASMFGPLQDAFRLDGEGPRFMQDLTLSPADNPSENGVSALLIDFPGAQTVEKNADLFVKRATSGAMCPHCAATALHCLMTNAPAGGSGIRTSVRGGGPLSTLVTYYQGNPTEPSEALWRDIACNVVEGSSFESDSSTDELADVFPWLRSIDKTMRGDAVQPLDVHPLQVYWATPRRIRLQFDEGDAAVCAICARSTTQVVERYQAKNRGLNYKGPWRHPLSPYYRLNATDEWSTVHPNPDGLTYKYWLGWCLGSRRSGREVVPASAAQAFLRSRGRHGQVRLWAFGYDMDNMKARCWYETRFPLFHQTASRATGAESTEALSAIIDLVISASEFVVQTLRLAIKDAWFGAGEARGNLAFVDAVFWNRTEVAFFALVEQLIVLCRGHGEAAFDQSAPLRRAWLETLRRAALRLFDEIAASGSVEAGNPVKLAKAYQSLRKQLYGPKLLDAIGLRSADPEPAPTKPRAAIRKPTRRIREKP